MKRKRKQFGTIFQAHGKWYVRYFEDRAEKGVVQHVRTSKCLGPVTTRGKRPPQAVRRTADRIVAAADAANARPELIVTFGDFIETIYFPHIDRVRRPSTCRGYREIWRNRLQSLCANEWLKDIKTRNVQAWLDSIAQSRNLARNTVKHIKTFLSAAFKLAKQQGFYDGENPVRDTAISPTLRSSPEPAVYSSEYVARILSLLPEPAATIFAVAAYTGLRRSEIQGLQWDDYENGCIRVTRSIWEGHVQEPKTAASKGIVPVIKQLSERLENYRVRSGNPVAGPMFHNEDGKPMNLNNVVNRQIKPALDRCKLCGSMFENHRDANHQFERDKALPVWRGWHAARRGLGSTLYRLGVPDKIIQQILRHANVRTTNDYYIKTVPEQALNAMGTLEGALPDDSLHELS